MMDLKDLQYFLAVVPGRHDNRGSGKAVHGPAAAEQADEGAGGRIRDNPVYQGKEAYPSYGGRDILKAAGRRDPCP